MKHMRKWCLLLLALGIQTILFGQSDPVLSVPSDAQMVIHVNLGKLAKKMAWSSVSKRDIFQYMLKDIPTEKQAYFTDPSNLGIDFSSGLWIAIKQDKTNGRSPVNYVMFTGYIADEGRFSNMVASMNTKSTSLLHQENGHFLIEGNNSLAWNTKQFVLLASPRLEKKTTKTVDKRMPKSFYTQKVKELAGYLYPDAQKSLFKDPRFQQLLQLDSDIRIWTDGSVDLKGKYARNDLPDGLNLGLMSKGNYKATTIDFEMGKIRSTTRQWINDSLAPIMKKMYSRPMNTALLQKIPVGNTLMVMNFSMDMAGLEQFFNQSGISKLMKQELQASNIKFEDFQEALQGDVMMAAVLPESYADQEEESPETRRNPFTDIQIFVAATVKDEKKMKKLVDTIQYNMEIAKKRKDSIRAAQIESWAVPDSPAVWSPMADSSFVEEEMVEEDSISYLSDTTAMEIEEIDLDDMSFPPPPPPKEVFKPVMDISDGLFVMTFSDKSLKAFKENKSNPGMKAFADLYGKKPMVFTLDMKTLMGFLGPILGSKFSSKEDENPLAVLDVFDKLIVSGGVYKNGAIESETEIGLSDPSLNSLEMVMNFLDMFGNVANRIGKGAIIKDEELDAPKEENVYSADDVPPPMEIKIEPSTSTEVDMKPDFVGGEKAWAKFLKKELNTQIPAKNGAPKGRYAVVIEFVVKEDGSYADFIALTNHGFGMEEEAMRVLSTVKKWKPAMKNDKPVESVYKKEIVFVVEN